MFSHTMSQEKKYLEETKIFADVFPMSTLISNLNTTPTLLPLPHYKDGVLKGGGGLPQCHTFSVFNFTAYYNSL